MRRTCSPASWLASLGGSWAVAVICFQMVIGRLPWDDHSVPEVRPAGTPTAAGGQEEPDSPEQLWQRNKRLLLQIAKAELQFGRYQQRWDATSDLFKQFTESALCASRDSRLCDTEALVGHPWLASGGAAEPVKSV